MDESLQHLQHIKTFTTFGVLAGLLGWETIAPFLPYFVRKLRERALHATRNFLLGALNSVVASMFVVTLWLWTTQWAGRHQFGIVRWLPLPGWAQLVTAVVLFDVWMYWWHRLNHQVPFLWRFHRTHHSDPFMDVTTANRFHLGEILLSSFLRIPVMALIGMELWQLVIHEVLMFTVVQFHHANVGLAPGLDRALRAVLVTPAMHKVHHSRWQPETDSNYASLLSVWDRVFGSFRLREDPRTIRFGLDGYDADHHQRMEGLLKTPLRGIARHPASSSE